MGKSILKINDWRKAQFFLLQISQPPNIPQKWFSTQNVPIDETDPNSLDFSFVKKSDKNHGVMVFLEKCQTL